ncbi:Ig-like domain-containing protein [bacterium]|nr:Ig-like domain-containing protein [bacterium]
MKTSLVNFVVFLLLAVGLTSCVEPKDESDFSDQQRIVSVTLQLEDQGQRSLWNPFRQSGLSTLPKNTQTILVVAVSESIGFTNEFYAISSYYDKALLDLNTFTVNLNLPLNTPIKLYEYAFGKAKSLEQLGQGDLVIASAAIDLSLNSSDVGKTKTLQSSLELVAAPSSLSISPAVAMLEIGAVQEFTATGVFQDGSSLGITNFVNWSVSDTSVATITDSGTSKGVLTVARSGIITVKAAIGTISATALVYTGTAANAPASANNTVTTTQPKDYSFSSGDFPFTGVVAGDTLAAVKITSLPSRGTLYLDSNLNTIVDSGESIAIDQVIAANDIQYLKFKPIPDENGTNYDQFTFTVSNGANYSFFPNTMTINVTAVSYSCASISSGYISDSLNFSGGATCISGGSSINIMKGHTITVGAAGTLVGSIQINPGGTLVVEEGTISSDIILNGGVLKVDGNLLFNGDITHTMSSTIDIQTGTTLDYKGSDIPVGSYQLTIKGGGEFIGSSSVYLNAALSHLYLSEDVKIETVTVGNTALFPGKGIEVFGNCMIKILYMGADAWITVVSGSLTIDKNLWITLGNGVELTISGSVNVGGIVLEADLDIDGVITLGEFAQLVVKADATFGAGSDLTFTGGVHVDPGVTLNIEDEDLVVTITFPGYSDIQGDIIVEGNDNLVFANPPLSGTVFTYTVTDNSTGTVTNIDVTTNLSSISPLWQSDFYCEEFEMGGCPDLEQAIAYTYPGFSWFMETDINGNNHSVHFIPDDEKSPLLGGDLYGRQLLPDSHDWSPGSEFVYLGRYGYTTVNGGIEAVIATGSQVMSFVTWVDSGKLYHAWYYTTDARVNGYYFDASDDLYVYFNQDMDTAYDNITGLPFAPTTSWINFRTFKVELAPYADGDTATLPMGSFQTMATNTLVEDGTFTIYHFVKVEGQVVDASGDPLEWSQVSSNLDYVKTRSDSGGNFTLATLSSDPSTDYQVFIEGGCDIVGYVKSGLTPAWQQHYIDYCSGGTSGPIVTSGLYAPAGVTVPNIGGIIWYHNSTETITWNTGTYDASGDLDIYLLYDDPTGLDATDSAILATNVNSKHWGKLYDNLSNSGTISLDPERYRDHGDYYRVLIIDNSGNWDISDNEFAIHLVNSGNEYNTALYGPNGGESWEFGQLDEITWDTSMLTTGRISIFLLMDDSTALDTTGDMATAVNSLKWEGRQLNQFNLGIRTLDPTYLGSNGTKSRVLVMDDAGSWDISDANFTITMVKSGNYHSTALFSPNGGENWVQGSMETLNWDSSLIGSGYLMVFALGDSTADLDETDPVLLTNAVNDKRWELRHKADAFLGSESVDPSHFSGSGSSSWLLIMDENGNWDISDTQFSISP